MDSSTSWSQTAVPDFAKSPRASLTQSPPMAFQEPPRRRGLTPIGEELRHREIEIGKPSLLDRWRRRRRLLPAPTTWYAVLLVGLVLLAIAASVAVGVTFLIAYLGGWTHGRALAKTFYAVGAFVMLGAVLAVASPMDLTSAYRTWAEKEQTRRAAPIFIALGLGLIVVGVPLDSRH